MTDAVAQPSTNVASPTPDTMALASRTRPVMVLSLPPSFFVLILVLPVY